MVTPLSSAADEKRFIADMLCKRVVRADFQTGELPHTPDPGALMEFYKQRLSTDFVKEDEWDEVCQRVLTWQEIEEQQGRPVLSRILNRFTKYPPTDRVKEVLGEERASSYRVGLETIECDPSISSQFPNERVSYPWRKFDMDAAVSVVTNVIAPNIGDEVGMTSAYQQLVCELRARRRERMNITAAEFGKRKIVVRALGIWFPITKDLDAWKTDPRTASIMPEFLQVMSQVVERMKLVRSYLQHIPRRRLSTRACQDLPANLERMKAYLKGFSS
jgi:hypothetical protein